MALTFINAQIVFDFLGVRSEVGYDSADVIFILGGGSLAPVAEAAQLYHDGVAPAIAFTSAGGTFGGNLVFGEEEIATYTKWLVLAGVRTKHLHFPRPDEKRTTNTLVEAQNALPFVRSRLGKISRMVLCSRTVHQRRAWATFIKQHGDVTYLNRPDNEPLTIELLPRLVQEIDRLREYGKKGDLKEQVIPREVTEVCEELRKQFPMHFPMTAA